MFSHVFNEERFTRVLRTTLCTRMSVNASMYPYMGIVVRLCVKTFAAVLTSMWFFASMNSRMNVKFVPSYKSLFADVALEWSHACMDTKMDG